MAYSQEREKGQIAALPNNSARTIDLVFSISRSFKKQDETYAIYYLRLSTISILPMVDVEEKTQAQLHYTTVSKLRQNKVAEFPTSQHFL